MAQTKKRKYNLTDFFSVYFENFGKLLLVNLLFCIPLALCLGGIYLIVRQTGSVSLFVVLLTIPLMSPFFAGLTNVLRKMTAEKTFRPIRDFFGGIRHNWGFFLINSILLYFLSAGMWIGIEYCKSTPDNSMFVVYTIIMAITAVIFLLVDLSAVVMSVTVELKFPELIRNSFILIINGFTNHLKTLLTLLFSAAVIYSIVALINQVMAVLIVMGVLTITIIPTLLMYIIVYNSYQNIEKHVISPYAQQKQEEQRIRLEKEAEDQLTVEDLLPLAKGDPEEYVFLNGKTVKRKTVIRMIEVRKNQLSDEAIES